MERYETAALIDTFLKFVVSSLTLAFLFRKIFSENVGGGDFLIYFDGNGAFRYKKGLTSQIRTSGPCLSDALYTSVTDDEAIKSEIQVSGGRTDDIVRVFIHIKHTALTATSFKRFAFFQMGSETYNYQPNTQTFAYGSGQTVTDSFNRTCGVATDSEGSFTNKATSYTTPATPDNMYNSVNSNKNVFREEFEVGSLIFACILLIYFIAFNGILT